MTIKIKKKNLRNIFNQLLNKNNKYFPVIVFFLLLLSTLGIYLLVGYIRPDTNIRTNRNSVYAQYPGNGNRISLLGSNDSCLRAGINTDKPFQQSNTDFVRSEDIGLGWTMSSVRSNSESIESICDKESNTIIRICEQDPNQCSIFALGDEYDQFIQTLNSLSCEVWVTGPSFSANTDSEELFTQLNIFMNTLIEDTSDNVYVLSPIIDSIDIPFRFSNNEYIISNWWSELDGIAVSTSSTEFETGYERLENFVLSKISGNRDVFVVNADIYNYQDLENDEKIEQIRSEVGNYYSNDQIKAVLFNDLFGQNSTPDFVIKQGLDEDEEFCNDSLEGAIVNPVEDDSYSCCDWDNTEAIDSCEVLQGPVNGSEGSNQNTQERGTDRLIAAVKLEPIPGSSNFQYHYVATQQIHHIPLLNYLASAKVNTVDDNSRNYQFTSPGAFVKQTNSFQEEDYDNRFEGIVQFTTSENEGFQIAVPDLGSAAAIGDANWMDYHGDRRPHCGLYYDEENNRFRYPFEPEIEPTGVDVVVDIEQRRNFFSDVLTRFFNSIDDGEFDIPETRRADANFFERIITAIAASNELSKCANQCTDSSVIPLRRCVHEDTIVLPRGENEIVVEEKGRNTQGEWINDSAELTPKEICDKMFLTEEVSSLSNSSVPRCHFSQNDFISLGSTNAAANYQAKLDSGLIPQFISNAGNMTMKIEIPRTGKMEMEGLLRMLENSYQIESTLYSRQFGGVKICHFDNVGINVPVTRRLYDRNLPRAFAGSDNSISIFNRLNPAASEFLHEPAEQSFKLRDNDNLLAGSCKVSADNFPFANRWSIASPWSQESGGTYNTQSTVNYLFPWIGQIPKMYERISTIYLEQESQRAAVIDKEEILQIYTDLIEDGIEEDPIHPLPFCDQLRELDQLWEDKTGKSNRYIYSDGTPKVDCLCESNDFDPLQEYLIDQDVVDDPLIERREFSEGDGDYIDYGQTAQCRVYDPGDPISEPNPNAEYSSISEGIISPVQSVTTLPNNFEFGGHPGLDIATFVGDPIFAVADGAVIFARDGLFDARVKYSDGTTCARFNSATRLVEAVSGNPCDWHDVSVPYQAPWWKEYGNMVAIQHEDYFSIYAHLVPGSVRVGPGDAVTQGQQIGELGNTGNSTGPHLHFELRTLEYATVHGYYNASTMIDPLEAYNSAINPNRETSDRTEVDVQCEIFDPIDRPEYEGTALSGGLNCLIKQVSDSLSSQGIIVSPELIGAIVNTETAGQCTHRWVNFPAGPSCNGDPNQTGLTTRNGLAWEGRINNGLCPVDIRGIGQISANIAGTNSCANTFNSTIRGYERAFRTCIEDIGVDTSIDRDIWEDPGSEFPDYSRLRVGDNLCFIGIHAYQLVTENPGSVTSIPDSEFDWNVPIPNANSNFSSFNNGSFPVDPVTYVAGRYHGNCTLDYCKKVHDHIRSNSGIYDNACIE